MRYLTEDKLAIFGSAGAIGSNMVQAALTMGLTPNIVMVDPYDKGNQGAAEEIFHCSFPGANVTWTSDAGEALRGTSYLISSGGAPRKEKVGFRRILRWSRTPHRTIGVTETPIEPARHEARGEDRLRGASR